MAEPSGQRVCPCGGPRDKRTPHGMSLQGDPRHGSCVGRVWLRGVVIVRWGVGAETGRVKVRGVAHMTRVLPKG